MFIHCDKYLSFSMTQFRRLNGDIDLLAAVYLLYIFVNIIIIIQY